jgi:DedD protein
LAPTNTRDDGFTEIQLSGKQLVFLFMAASVVSVVIFICGVMVGRGVRIDRGAVAQAAALNEAPEPDATAAVAANSSTIAGGDPTAAAPPQPVDDLGYFDRLGDSKPATEEMTPAVSRSPREKPANPTVASANTISAAATTNSRAVAASAKDKPARPSSTPAVVPPPAKESASTPSPATASTPQTPAADDGFAVQVAAVNGRRDADAIAKKLSAKGYPAFVQSPAGGTGSVFRVRVGTFKTRREAETVAAKLQKEEQIKPWVTR